jgi:hypothetical protein
MNRVILIGNGFDLAHGLKTSYKDFINHFWEKKLSLFIETHNRKNFISSGNIMSQRYSTNKYIYEDEDIFVDVSDYRNTLPLEIITQNISGFDKFNSFITHFRIRNYESNLRYKNGFLSRITSKQQLENWIDIEEEYYNTLVACLKKPDEVRKLHEDFHIIQIALEIYLVEQCKNKIAKIPTVEQHIYSSLSPKDFINKPNADSLNYILFLNFNYTQTANIYNDSSFNKKIIHIHGELQNNDNPIIFGYGDEIDDKYSLLEKENKNEYLENIKTFKYSLTSNYKDMLRFINSDEYQIFVMGHSCGISDRTLLNTLFEHENCKSIKIFYHKENDVADNYMDINMNISRHFTQKKKIREIIVSKENSLPLT